MGEDPGRRQLNRQYAMYLVTLVLVAVMLAVVKRMYGAP